ncbi:hypothetical protein L596_029949 [Steinernema carpocapsae]|uniref:Uncharacterized protein n=1 Tax=Steinernema carpocapsae TaxID=34508 RepID=A0A4V5ZX60_STECR|nr:hypothetical protein L596_029949 [Steinernema carpocapsae]
MPFELLSINIKSRTRIITHPSNQTVKLFLSILIVIFFLSAAFGKVVHSVSNINNANPSNLPKLYCIGGLCPTGFECDA